MVKPKPFASAGILIVAQAYIMLHLLTILGAPEVAQLRRA
jgi:uncharacterized protein (DUF697 family)